MAATGHESKQLPLTPLKVLVRVGLHLGVWHPLEALQQARLVNCNVFPPMPDTHTTSSRLLTGKISMLRQHRVLQTLTKVLSCRTNDEKLA